MLTLGRRETKYVYPALLLLFLVLLLLFFVKLSGAF